MEPISYRAMEAWERLPDSRFDYGAAAHLLRRVGFAAVPKEVHKAVQLGLDGTLDQLLKPPQPIDYAEAASELQEHERSFQRERRSLSEGEQRIRRNQLRQRREDFYDEALFQWAERMRNGETSAAEHLVLFLFNVFVISAETVRSPIHFMDHLSILRENFGRPYPELCKAVSRSPGMIQYLNLDRSTKERPNENFARELMELFVLGEGNYGEKEVKEAARAFTGYRIGLRGFRFDRRVHDSGKKTLFGVTRNFDGDGVIDLLFEQKAARTFLPGQLALDFLDHETMDGEVLAALGELWARDDFRFDRLCRTFFGGRYFFEPQFRGKRIKSPVQVLFGSLQELGLAVNPTRRYIRNPLRAMGQDPWRPPNVRGWVGGRTWITGATLAARRYAVQGWFERLDLEKMNADDRLAFERVQESTDLPLRVSAEVLSRMEGMDGEDLARTLLRRFLSAGVSREFYDTLVAALKGAGREDLPAIVLTLLQTPEYQLC
ncbi:MAG: DUF1800 family protein [Puniceicoccaceae bacterium]